MYSDFQSLHIWSPCKNIDLKLISFNYVNTKLVSLKYGLLMLFQLVFKNYYKFFMFLAITISNIVDKFSTTLPSYLLKF